MTAVAIDPVTLDYSVVNGALVRDVSGGLLNAIVIRILTPLGSYWYDSTIGSKLYLLRRAKDIVGIDLIAKEYVLQALQALIDDGRATAVDVVTSLPYSGWLTMLVTVTSATGQRVTFEHPIQVGL